MAKPEKRIIPNDEMIDALIRSHGIMTEAAKMLGCHHSTISRRVAKEPDVKAAYEAANEMTIDNVENELLNHIFEKHNLTATIYFLKTKGRHRGWAERYEVTGGDGEPLQVTVNYAKS